MKILLDCSPNKIEEYSKRYNYNFGQLRTPLTSYSISGKQYGLDNGCFKRFDRLTWRRLLKEAKAQNEIDQPVFVCAPDIVGDARRTLELFDLFYEEIKPLKACLVLQDGIGEFSIDWHKVDAVFVGGSDAFKISNEAINACKTAKILGKWVHVGRVNTVERVKNWLGLADSIDGSGISKYDHMLEAVLSVITGDLPQDELFKEAA
jgi:hypothetical protein